MTKSQLSLALHLIGWDDGASFLYQSQSKVRYVRPKKRRITFDTRLKLLWYQCNPTYYDDKFMCSSIAYLVCSGFYCFWALRIRYTARKLSSLILSYMLKTDRNDLLVTFPADCREETTFYYVTGYTKIKTFYTKKCGLWGLSRCKKSKWV